MLTPVLNLHTQHNLNIIKSNVVSEVELDMQEIVLTAITRFINTESQNNIIPEMDRQAMIIMSNYKSSKNPDDAMSILFIYAVLQKESYGYSIMYTNWLNWISKLSSSMENSHDALGEIDKTSKKDKKPFWKKLSPAGALRAFNPLIYFTPKKLQNKINVYNLYEVINPIDPNNTEFSKDYSRNFYSKVYTNLKCDFKIVNNNITKSELADMLTPLLPEIGLVALNSELEVPPTCICVKPDLLLEFQMKLSLNQPDKSSV